MSAHTGVYAVYFLYRSRYAFVSSHSLKNGEHNVTLDGLEKALLFMHEADAYVFIERELQQEVGKLYHVTELSLDELLQYCPQIYELRRASMNHGAA